MKLIKQQNSTAAPIFILIKSVVFVSCFISSFLIAESPEKRSRLTAEIEAARAKKIEEYQKLHPTYISLKEDLKKEEEWNKSKAPAPHILQQALPEGVFFINHQLPFAADPFSIKLEEGAKAGIVKAEYEYKGKKFFTNVTFNKYVFAQNIQHYLDSKPRWLARANAAAAILYFHGGGTKTSSGSTATAYISHFASLNVDVVAIDLPFHGEGTRQFMSLEDDILAAGAFARKYIPPHVPLFVLGHSWGAVITDELMQMTGRREGTDWFHNSLTGIITSAPALNPAPGEPIEKIISETIRRSNEAKQRTLTEAPEYEQNVWSDIYAKNKTGPLNSLKASLSILMAKPIVPADKGENLIPTLVIVGKGDPLVYLGYEDLFQKYYPQLKNVQYHLLDKLIRIQDKNKEEIIVGHLLTDYQTSKTDTTPINFRLVGNFIAQQLGLPESVFKHKIESLPQLKEYEKWLTLADIAALYSNNLAFREWLKSFKVETELPISKAKEKLHREYSRKANEYVKTINKYAAPNQLLQILMDLAQPSLDDAEKNRIIEKLNSMEDFMKTIKQNNTDMYKNIYDQLILADIPNQLLQILMDLAQPPLDDAEKNHIIKKLNSMENFMETIKQNNMDMYKNIYNELISAEDISQTAIEVLSQHNPFHKTPEGQEAFNRTEDISQMAMEQLLFKHSNQFHKIPEGKIERHLREAFDRKDSSSLIDYLDHFLEREVKEAEEYLKHFEKEEKKPPLQIPPEVKTHIKNLHVQYHTYQKGDDRKKILSSAVQILRNYYPLYIAYQLLMNTAKAPPPQNKEHYKKDLIYYREYFSNLDQFQNLTAMLSELIEAPSFEKMREKTSNILTTFPLIRSIHRDSPALFTMFGRYMASDGDYNKEVLSEDLNTFFLPEDTQKQIFDLFEERKKNPERKIIYKAQMLIIENTPINKQTDLHLILKQINYENTLADLIQYFSYAEHPVHHGLTEISKSNSPEKKRQTAYMALIEFFIHPQLELSKSLIKKIQKVQNKEQLKEVLKTEIPNLDSRNPLAPTKTPWSEIAEHFGSFLKIDHFLKTRHTPSLEDFYSYHEIENLDEKQKKEEEYKKTIASIEGYVQDVQKLKIQLKQLNNNYKKLLENSQEMNNQIKHHIKMVQTAFTEALRQPPDNMKAQYEYLDFLHTEMTEAGHQLMDAIEKASQGLHKAENIQEAIIKSVTAQDSEIPERTKEALKKRELWLTEYGRLNQLLSDKILSGELGLEMQESFAFIYGKSARGLNIEEDSQYQSLKFKLQKLAEMESEMITVTEKIAKITAQYYQYYPSLTATSTYLFSPWDILNETNGSLEELKRHVSEQTGNHQRTLQIWNKFKGRHPPPAPVSCSGFFTGASL